MTDEQSFDPRAEIAEAYGLPKGWGSRLRGSTPRELAADAAELAAYFHPAEPSKPLAPPTRPDRPSGGLDPDGIDDRDDDEGGSSHVIWR